MSGIMEEIELQEINYKQLSNHIDIVVSTLQLFIRETSHIFVCHRN